MLLSILLCTPPCVQVFGFDYAVTTPLRAMFGKAAQAEVEVHFLASASVTGLGEMLGCGPVDSGLQITITSFLNNSLEQFAMLASVLVHWQAGAVLRFRVWHVWAIVTDFSDGHRNGNFICF